MRTQRKVLQDSKVKSILTPRPLPGSGLEFGYIDVRDEDEGEEHTLLRWFDLLRQKILSTFRFTLLSHFVLDGDVAHANLLKFALTEQNVESTTVLVSSSSKIF